MKKIFLVGIFLTLNAYADCNHLKVTTEIKSCLVIQHEMLNDRLTNTYHLALSTLPKADRKNLINAQRAWVRFKEADCYAAIAADAGGTAASIIGLNCTNNKISAREKEIKELYIR